MGSILQSSHPGRSQRSLGRRLPADWHRHVVIALANRRGAITLRFAKAADNGGCEPPQPAQQETRDSFRGCFAYARRFHQQPATTVVCNELRTICDASQATEDRQSLRLGKGWLES